MPSVWQTDETSVAVRPFQRKAIMAGAVVMFEQEIKVYEKEKNGVLKGQEGKYVLIQGDQIAGIWETYEDAVKAGYLEFALKPFFVKQIQQVEQVFSFTRNLVLCQSSPHNSAPAAL